jgi:hypothetical protein
VTVKEKRKLECAAEQLRKLIVAGTLMETCVADVEEVWTAETTDRLKDRRCRSMLCCDTQHQACIGGKILQPCRGLRLCRKVRITEARLVEEIGLKEKYRKVKL